MLMVPEPCNGRINFERCCFFFNYTGAIGLIAIDLIYTINATMNNGTVQRNAIFHLESIQFIQGILAAHCMLLLPTLLSQNVHF